MHKAPKKFKSPPKKYHPKGLAIIYEDHDLLVVDKVCGMPVSNPDKDLERTALNLLNDYVRKGNPKSHKQVFSVHRLDKETSGILVLAKSAQAQQFLRDEWKNFRKKFIAVVHGSMPKKEGMITYYLAENAALKMYVTPDTAEGKYSKTGYTVLRESHAYSLLEIDQFTSNKDQIRVHLANKGCPVVGDSKYGKKATGIKRMALHSSAITLAHPFTKEKMTFESKTPPYFNFLMRSDPDLGDI